MLFLLRRPFVTDLLIYFKNNKWRQITCVQCVYVPVHLKSLHTTRRSLTNTLTTWYLASNKAVRLFLCVTFELCLYSVCVSFTHTESWIIKDGWEGLKGHTPTHQFPALSFLCYCPIPLSNLSALTLCHILSCCAKRHHALQGRREAKPQLPEHISTRDTSEHRRLTKADLHHPTIIQTLLWNGAFLSTASFKGSCYTVHVLMLQIYFDEVWCLCHTVRSPKLEP